MLANAAPHNNVGVAVVVTLFSAFLLLSVLTALRPGRKGVVKILAYPVGWAAGELALQAIAAQLAAIAFLVWWKWPRQEWLSTTLIVISSLVVLCNLILLGVQFHARTVVARAMSREPNEPLALGRPRDDQFGSWWRTLLQVPLHPRDLLVQSNVPYGPLKRQRLDVWRLSTTPVDAPIIFFVHGGAWIFGDKREQGRPMLHEFVSRGWIAVAMNYRLAPRYRWPAQIEDVTRALGWIKQSASSLGGDPERIVIAGGSAGGHLAALAALCADDPQWRPQEFTRVTDWSVRGCISLYGVLEMTGDDVAWDGHGDKLRDLLENTVVGVPVAEHEDLYRSLSPVERITHDAPPFLVIQGGNDTMVDVHVARYFVERFRRVATAPVYYVEIPLTQHAFDVSASPRTSATVRAAVAFAEHVTSTSRATLSSR